MTDETNELRNSVLLSYIDIDLINVCARYVIRVSLVSNTRDVLIVSRWREIKCQ